MKIYTRVVLDWDGHVLEEESYDYTGPLTLCSGGGPSSTTQVQKSEPWEEQKPYLLDIFEQAKKLYTQGPPEMYQGNTTVGYNPTEQAAQQAALDYAQNGMQTVADNAQAGTNFLTSGAVLNADTNPYMQQYAKGAIRPIFNELKESTLPQIQGGALAAGQLGGSRQGIAEGLAVDRATQNALDTTARMYSDAYGQNLEAQQRGLALAPQTAQLGLLPAQTQAGVGEAQRAYEQALLNDEIRRFEYGETADWNNLAALQSMIQGNYGGTGTATSTGGGVSTGSKLLGAGMSGLGMYAGLMATPLAPIAAPIAGAMALASLF